MLQAIRERVTVKPGGTIEIHNPALPEGASAEVIIMIETPVNQSPLPPLSSFIGAAKGCFSSAQEIDDYINGLRDEWGR